MIGKNKWERGRNIDSRVCLTASLFIQFSVMWISLVLRSIITFRIIKCWATIIMTMLTTLQCGQNDDAERTTHENTSNTHRWNILSNEFIERQAPSYPRVVLQTISFNYQIISRDVNTMLTGWHQWFCVLVEKKKQFHQRFKFKSLKWIAISEN